MAFQTIRIKNSNVAGKVPAAGQLDTAELVLNLKDQKLYSKNAAGQVFQVGGGVNSGGDPPNSGNEIGDLFWDGDVLLVWDGGQWVPVVEAQEVDLGYTAATDGGTVTNTAGNNAELPLADKTNAGLMSPEGFEKLEDITTIISSELEPADKEIGDVWLDMGDCPPTLKVWTDCQNPGVPEWLPVAGGGGGGNLQGAVQIVSNNGTDLYSTLTAVGGNGVDSEGTTVNATYAWTGAKTGAGATILADVEGSYTVTATVEFPDGSKQTDVASWTIVDSYIPPSNNTAPVIAVVGEGEDGAYEGNSTYVVTNATVLNGANPTIEETQWFLNGVANSTGTVFTIPDSSVGAVITSKQKFTDLRGTELVSEASNAITIVERPADAITFDPKISDDGTAAGNQVGKTLTAAADNIVGGVAPQEYAFQWYADDSPESGGDQKTKVILPTDVGKVITCEITVAESDGTNPESRRATYGKTPVSGLAVGKGVISPALNNFEGDTLTGSATVTGAVGSANETYVWELDGSEVQRGSSATYVAAAGLVKFRKEVTDNYITKVGEWSDPVTVIENTGPNATMHGLRFDGSRKTYFDKTCTKSSGEQFTISAWVKRNKASKNFRVLTLPYSSSGQYTIVDVSSSGEFRWQFPPTSGDNSVLVVSTGNVPLNTWTHVVGSVDYAKQSAKLYINGVDVTPGGALTGFVNYFDGLPDGTDPRYCVGAFPVERSADPVAEDISDGYMSDIYFVEGTKDAETFGKLYEGKWGPLTSSKVLENIGYKESPADSAPNYDQKWSDNLSISPSASNTTAGSATSLAFDGNESTYFDTNVSGGGQAIVDLNITIENVETLEFYGGPSPAGNGLITVTGDGITESLIGNMGANKQSITVNNSTVSNLKFTVDNDNAFRMAALYVNGRTLIDGPADTSQVWSTNTVGEQQSSNPASNAFDGTLTTYSGLDTAANSTLTTSFSGLVGITSLRISAQIYNFSGSPSPVLKVNGVDVYPDWLSQNGSTTDSGTRAWVDLGSTYSTLDSVEWGNSAADDAMYVNAIEVDGKLLVDAPPEWNMSQVWSDQQNDVYDVRNLFDGSLNTYTCTTLAQASWTMNFSPALSGPIRVYTGTWNSDLNWTTNEDNGTVAISSSGWYDITDATAVTQLTIARSPDGSPTIAAIEVAGKVLVDQGSIGANGFYLPFDPAATGENYSSSLSSTNGYQSTGSPGNAFDGNLSTAAKSNNASTGDAVLAWTGDVDASVVKFYVNGPNDGASNLVVNEGLADEVTIQTDNSDPQIISVNLSTNKLRNFKLKASDATDGTVWLYGIEVDGEILIDHNSIGVDASGQDNHFHDKNFSITDDDELWSSGISIDKQYTLEGFGGSSSLVAYVYPSFSGTFTFTPPKDIPITKSYEFYMHPYGVTSDASGFTATLDGITVNLGDRTEKEWQSIPEFVGKTISSTTPIIFTHDGSGSNRAYLPNMRVDGIQIVDKNQVDTVLDTPMKSYAVLNEGKNGNLKATNTGNNLSYVGEIGKNYYYEANGTPAMHPGGATFSSQVDWAYNFGQQPFVGTITETDDSQIWSSGWDDKVFGGGTAAFDGNVLTTSANTDSYGSGVGSTLTTNIPFSSSVVLHVCTSSSEYVKVNGTQVIGENVGNPSTRPLVTPTAVDITDQVTSPITEIFISREESAGSAYLFGVEIDGKLLVDTGAGGIPISRDNLLYQTWEQYARTALGYTQDELAKATKKLAEQEPYVQLMRALVREWQPGSTYSYGDIVQVNGMTYQAEANDVKLAAPDAATADGAVLWRPLVRIAPAKTLSDVLPEPEQPTVLPAPDEEVDFAPGASGSAVSTMTVGEDDAPKRARNEDGTFKGDDPSTPGVNEAWEGGEEPPAKGKRGRKKS